MADSYNYTWGQGEDLTLAMVYKKGLPGQETAVNLTGYSLRMDVLTAAGVRKFTFNSAAIADVDPVLAGSQPDNAIEATLGTDGTITITIPRSMTLPGGELYADITAVPPTLTFNYDIFLRDTSNKQKKILQGQITIEKSYTLWP